MVIRVIYGPPGAGKSTYVEQHRAPGELVVDMDTLCVALGSPDSHTHDELTKAVAGAARASAIRRIIDRDADAWIIDSRLRTKSLRENAERCEFILIDPGETIAAQRAHTAGRPPASLDAIHAWYADPPIPPATARTADKTTSSHTDLGTAVTDWW